MNPDLSVVVISQNAERHFEACLNALKKVSDDVVIVDHYSEDATVEIAKAAGCRVFSKKWTGYSAGKNFGNAKAKHDWILSIDADEVLSDELIQSINSLEPDDKQCVYAINCLSSYCGNWVKHGSWYPDWHIRLFNRLEVSWNLEEVHETLALPAGVSIVKLKGSLYHYTVDTIEQHQLKIEHYASLGAQKMYAAGRKPSIIIKFLNPPFRFMIDYFFRGGILDGKAGWHIARLTAKEKWLKYAKLQQLIKQKNAL